MSCAIAPDLKAYYDSSVKPITYSEFHAMLDSVTESNIAELFLPRSLPSMNEYLESIPKPDKSARYHLTFTHNASSCDKPTWFKRLSKIVTSTMWLTWAGAIEHIDSNIHCHMYVTVKYPNLSDSKFKSWNTLKTGKIHYQKVKTDNGITEYISKENKSFDNPQDFIRHYEPLII